MNTKIEAHPCKRGSAITIANELKNDLELDDDKAQEIFDAICDASDNDFKDLVDCIGAAKKDLDYVSMVICIPTYLQSVVIDLN